MIRILIIIFFSPIAVNIQAQELSYTHYDLKEGLAGSVVYSMTQDKQGFLWFGTETGLSRFDGSRFVNFSTLDGLPDNEILKVFSDYKSRVWIAPFRASVCYYYKGKIFNADNDPMLAKIKISNYLIGICQSTSGDVLLTELGALHIIKPDGKCQSFNQLPGTGKPLSIVQTGPDDQGGFWVLNGTQLFRLQDGHFTLVKNLNGFAGHNAQSFFRHDKLVFRESESQYNTYSAKNLSQKLLQIFVPGSHTRIIILNDSMVVRCFRLGADLYNLNKRDSGRIYLPGKAMNDVFIDNEKNTWFCSQGHGVYKLNSETITNVKADARSFEGVGVTSITERNGCILMGTERETIAEMCFGGTSIHSRLFFEHVYTNHSAVTAIHNLPNNDVLMGTGHRLFRISASGALADTSNFFALKSMYLNREGKLVAGTNGHVLIIDPLNLKNADTIWSKRTTYVYPDGDSIYVAGLEGVYKISPDKGFVFLGAHEPLLKNRITAMTSGSDGTIWMATFGSGILAYRHGKVVAHIDISKGLTSNVCKAIFLQNGHLWVGTDKGVNKIDVNDPAFPIVKFTTADGLLSNSINAIYQNDSIVFIGSAAGLTYFNEKYIASSSVCDLRMNGIYVGGELFGIDTTNFQLPHHRNNIRFDFVGISFRSVGDIRYRYRLLGLDSNWQFTREIFLSYPTLPGGQYELQVQAINKFGVSSEIVSTRFQVLSLIWEKGWFQVLIFLLTTGLIALVVRHFILRTKRQEAEKRRISSRISELEQLALKAQMNPHFIFNSLNSIQQYVMDKDVAGANRFITGFSKLIRQTLDFSSRSSVPLSDEIGYLKTYLELEKNRLEDKFTYTVEISPLLQLSNHLIPPMIIQPYLENSIRHGIRFRKDNRGKIRITVVLNGERIICVVEDNGVGRAMAAQYKTLHPIEYQSKGMQLTADRLDLINRGRTNKIEVAIDDLLTESGDPAGTRVTISFPDSLA